MQKFDEKKLKRWIILVCSQKRKEGGIYFNDLLSLNPEKTFLSADKLLSLLQELIKQGLITQKERKGHLNLFYIATTKGGRALDRLTEQEYLEILRMTPPEYELRYRGERVEKTLFSGVMAFVLFKIASDVLGLGSTSGLIILLFAYIFFLVALMSFGNLSSIIINDWLNAWNIWTVEILEKKQKTLATFINLLLLVGFFILWYFASPENFQEYFWQSLVVIFLAWFSQRKEIQDKLMEFLDWSKNQLKRS